MATRNEKTGTRSERRMERRLRNTLLRKNGVDQVETFEEAGVMTRNCGLVVRLMDGTKFQIEILEDRRGW